MGQQQSTTQVPGEAPVVTHTPVVSTNDSVSKCPVSGKKEEASGCPVKGGKQVASVVPPVTVQQDSSKAAECPVSYKNPNVYNVYNQKIDPTNQMPSQANQAPAPGQSTTLSVEREPSSIPKGGTDSTWVYPSPQMFWNALVRKEKVEGALEEDMESVVRIHNSMNEATWLQILEWEKLHRVDGPGREPKLLRFLGRPDELSPKAKLKVWAGHAAPFDRHDWVVDRGGTEVRYVIDYYHDEAGAPEDKTPKDKHDLVSVKSIKLDVRPALDSPQSIIDRIVLMPFYRLTGKSNFKPLPFFPESATVIAEQKKLEIVRNSWNVIRQNCEREALKLKECKTEQDCANAYIAVQHCSAKVVCPNIAKDFQDSLEALPYDEEKTHKIYTTMEKCLELFQIDLKNASEKKK